MVTAGGQSCRVEAATVTLVGMAYRTAGLSLFLKPIPPTRELPPPELSPCLCAHSTPVNIYNTLKPSHRMTPRETSLIMDVAESSSSDESLDVTNTSFDPLKFLYSEKTKIPVPSAPIYDNVSKFEAKLKGIVIKTRDNPKVPNPHSSSSQCTREFDAFKYSRNVLSRMENILGPLQVLYNCMETKTRIKVYTRSVRGIRGYIEAYVVAFDKHWNLALQDCLETWTRKVKRKAPALGTPEKLEMIEENVPKMIVKKSNGKTETLERHVPQMMLRGEQVVIIIKMN